MFLRKIKIAVVLLPLIVFLFEAKSQTNIDSLSINFLVKNELIKSSDVVYKKKIMTKGKIGLENNIYINKVFCLNQNDEILNIYGFGVYSVEESPRCMLFEYGYKNNNQYFFLGVGRIEEELLELSNILKLFKGSLKPKYQIQILEIYNNYKKGKIEIPNHLNCLNR